MAARLRKTHQEDVRAKIQASQLINVLQDHAFGKTTELPASRLKAIEILLRKSVPDLSQVQAEISGADGGEIVHRIVLAALDDDSADQAS
jgi:hypothetical protein